jgi:RimJ/RimL family protein N-acetyltransferase
MAFKGVTAPPRRIETARLVIRCYEEDDATPLKEAVDASLDHLRPWMPWTRFEPQTIDQKRELIRAWRQDFDSGEGFVFGIFERGGSRLVGGTGLHRRSGPYALEVGYWIRPDMLRQGIATEVTAVLTRVAFEHCDASRVDIQIDPENERSRGVPLKLGFRHELTMLGKLEPKTDGGPRRDSMLFSVLREEYDGSPCAAYLYALGSTTTPSSSA